MKYIDEFRDRKLISKVVREIHKRADSGRRYRIMDVCGTHTMNIFKFGLKDLLPENIELISGPGCPVCVTPNDYLDKAIALSHQKGVIIAAFGDMLRVPGSYSSLEGSRAAGGAVKVVYSSLDALDIARRNPDKEVVFLGVGFETTSPTVAASILIAKREGMDNYTVLSAHKTMPNALKALSKDADLSIDGFVLPGHVSAVIGLGPYRFLSKRYSKGGVVTGFEPLDILEAILMLISQKSPKIEVEYRRVADRSGNSLARKVVRRVFEEADSRWRGIGLIKCSGLKIRRELSRFDAGARFNPKVRPAKENKNCICGDVLRGAKRPLDCRLFRKVCNPANPVGSCMVSSEGTCAAYYRYG